MGCGYDGKARKSNGTKRKIIREWTEIHWRGQKNCIYPFHSEKALLGSLYAFRGDSTPHREELSSCCRGWTKMWLFFHGFQHSPFYLVASIVNPDAGFDNPPNRFWQPDGFLASCMPFQAVFF